MGSASVAVELDSRLEKKRRPSFSGCNKDSQKGKIAFAICGRLVHPIGNMADEVPLAETISAVTGLVNSPVYDDGLKPAVQELGKTLHLAMRAVNAALSPLRGCVWGIEQIEEFVIARVGEKLKSTPPEQIVPPPTEVAGPALEALRFATSTPDLRELYAGLLATAMNVNTQKSAFPAFVEIIKQLSVDEARILGLFVDIDAQPLIELRIDSPDGAEYRVLATNVSQLCYDAGLGVEPQGGAYVDNLSRLDLVEVSYLRALIDQARYRLLEADAELIRVQGAYAKTMPTWSFRIQRGTCTRTAFGAAFLRACGVAAITPKSAMQTS